jgi:hypothetical protein
MMRIVDLAEFSVWVCDEQKREKVRSQSADFATRKTALARIEVLDHAEGVVVDFLAIKSNPNLL